MRGKDGSPFSRTLDVDEDTLERLRQITAIDLDQPEVALEAMAADEESFREFGKQSGVAGSPEFQEILRLIRVRDHTRGRTGDAIGEAHDAAKVEAVQFSGRAVNSFLAGLGIGIALGILFAPMSGEESRSNLQQRAAELADSARDLIEHGRDRVRSTISAIRGQADRAARSSQESTGTNTATRS
jgi:gas vesicle protein